MAIAVRESLNPFIGHTGAPFVLFFPAVAAACVFFGESAGAACLAICAVGGALLFLPPFAKGPTAVFTLAPLAAFAVSGGALLWLTASLKDSLLNLRGANEQESILNAELQHRVKNTLAIVQSIAAQSFRGAEGPMVELFTERLVALGQAHNLLSDAGWGSVSLETLLERALEPILHSAGARIAIRGDDVRVPTDQVVGLALCLHELAANAVRHGALSNETGRIEIAWRSEQAPSPHVRLEWREWEGPPVSAPLGGGFGARLLERGLSSRVSGPPRLQYLPEGLCWRVEFDLAAP